MEQITEILIDNLRESFKAIEKFLHWWRRLRRWIGNDCAAVVLCTYTRREQGSRDLRDLGRALYFSGDNGLQSGRR